jgi:prevent-host-death family protein
MLTFSARSLQRSSGEIQDRALVEPVGITKHGRVRLVLLSADEYERLKRRDRDVVAPSDVDQDTLARIADAEPPTEADAFNHEIDDQTT